MRTYRVHLVDPERTARGQIIFLCGAPGCVDYTRAEGWATCLRCRDISFARRIRENKKEEEDSIMTKPLFLEKFEELHNTLTVLAAQEVRPIPAGANPEAVQIMAAEMYEKSRTLTGQIKQAARALGEVCETLRDLEMSRDPDQEILARAIFAAGHSARPVKADQAFAAAKEFIEHRNRLRDQARPPAISSEVARK